jgi:hypothetical protein
VWLKLLAVAEQNPVHATPEPKAGVAFRFFNSAQAATIEAVTDQIIPAREDPGAKWAGVVHYIDLALAGDLKVCRLVCEGGIERLDTLAHGLAGKPFSALEFTDQTSVLKNWSKTKRHWARQPAAEASSNWCGSIPSKVFSAIPSTVAIVTGSDGRS